MPLLVTATNPILQVTKQKKTFQKEAKGFIVSKATVLFFY